ncbi:3'-5' exonuclease [Rhizobium leucaenae]|uniref:DNA polymerase-3 subunit epsilon n=1 Tax=Rhizobium leucaenae TaxID=29450 RepID=A0A7W6ZZ51_9HYPH|nr:3'-5' exonuclease [Rhizobium leucaenae]MBB4571324.1 DNA polymerase-3 subunit epsilon [Rhizobium leucaenae]MBB6305305.1 DNA polymerase-3 subunit epsilon [Rhizobium leucaenae]
MPQQFDLFASNEIAPRRALGSSATKRRPATALTEDEMVHHLLATGKYRILKKLCTRDIAAIARPGFPLQGVILDTETTGLDHRKDEIIEIGAIAFTFDTAGNIGDVVGVYGGLQQPMNPIPADITRLTGITDEMVSGQMIDMAQLRTLIIPADIIIAHNAGFDRPFCEAFSPIFSGKAWACSVSEIDWTSRGFEGTKLGYLIGQAGYFHEGHRAVDDCFALFEVLAQARGTLSTPFAELYEASARLRVRIFAENSPFDMKDHLKARGYRWADGSDGGPKSWWIEIAEDALDDELRYLRSEIYRWNEADPPTQRLTAFDRFKA